MTTRTYFANREEWLKIRQGLNAQGIFGGWKVSWTAQTRTSLDRKAVAEHFGGNIPDNLMKASTTRIMRITHKKN